MIPKARARVTRSERKKEKISVFVLEFNDTTNVYNDIPDLVALPNMSSYLYILEKIQIPELLALLIGKPVQF